MNSHYKIEKIQTEINHVGIDVSKQHLDVSIAGSKTQRLANTQAGLRLLHQKLGRLAHPASLAKPLVATRSSSLTQCSMQKSKCALPLLGGFATSPTPKVCLQKLTR